MPENLQREGLEKLVGGQDEYLIQSIAREGRVFDFQSTPIFFFSGRDAEKSDRNRALT